MLYVIMRELSDGREIEVETHHSKFYAEKRLNELSTMDTACYYYLETR